MADFFYMEFKTTLSISERGYSVKPNPKYMRFRRCVCDIDMLSSYIQNGYSFCGDFGFEDFPVKDHKTTSNFKSTNIVSVDIDDCPIDTLESLVDCVAIKPFIGYETFSHQTEGKGNRYRLLFAFAEPIDSPSAYKQAYKWVIERLGLDDNCVDCCGQSCVQIMHGTGKDRKVLKIGYVIEGVAFEDLGDVCVKTVDLGRYKDEIELFKSEILQKIPTVVPCVKESFDRSFIEETDIKYVSDNWLIEKGYAVDISGILWVGRKIGYKDGQRRRQKLHSVIKGVTQLNKDIQPIEILRYAWFLNHTIMNDRLSVNDVVEQSLNAYEEAMTTDTYTAPEGWRNKRGYRLVPMRGYIGKPEPEGELDDETKRVIDSVFCDCTPKKVGFEHPEQYVLCTKEEATCEIGGLHFFKIGEKNKKTINNKIGNFNSFKKIMKDYKGKTSVRKVAEWLCDNGYAIRTSTLTEYLKKYNK